MKRIGWICPCLILLIGQLYSQSKFKEDIPIDVKRLSDRAIVLTGIPLPAGCQITALSTDRGLVVIDTGGTPSFAKEARRVIEQEFNSSDFSFAILTHDHPDHSNGTNIFPEAVIIGHEICREIIAHRKPFSVAEDSNLNINLKTYKQSAARLRSQLDELGPNSERSETIHRRILSFEMAAQDLREGFTIQPPSIGFDKKMTLNLGNMTIVIYDFGPYHSDNDIFIHIPEEGILIIGDIFSKSVLPGYAARNRKVDVPLWLDVFKSILTDRGNIKYVVRGHNEIFPGEFIEVVNQYINDLWEKVSHAHAEGLALPKIQNICSFDQYAFIADVMEQNQSALRDQHEKVVEGFWRQFQEKKFVYPLLVLWDRDLNGIGTHDTKKEFIKRYKELVTQKEDYFFDEPSIIWVARGFLAAGSVEDAIELLNLHLVPFPESADTYATLGQAYVRNEMPNQAFVYLQKALSLNPDHAQAKVLLAKLKEKK